MNTCEPCPMGTFSSQKWQTSCTACPADENGVLMGTEDTGTVSPDQCIGNTLLYSHTLNTLTHTGARMYTDVWGVGTQLTKQSRRGLVCVAQVLIT